MSAIFAAALECALHSGRLSTEKCATRLSLDDEDPLFAETFVLSFDDPIEYFRYESRWAPLAPWLYVRLPVVGYIRDRFLTDDPFDSSLFFTTSYGGAGLQWEGPYGRVYADASAVFVKQRYAPNYIHSDVDSDPEHNHVYALAHAALYRTLGFEVRPLASRIRLGAAIAVTELRYRGDYMADSERSLFVRAPFALHLGLSLQFYSRTHTIRFDGSVDRHELARGGLLAEF